jgi:hypothetical protein
LAVAVMAAVPALVVPARADYPGVPPEVAKVLQRDWCDPSSYDAARRAARHPLTDAVRRNLTESERTARKYPKGCRLAERATRHTREQFRPSAPWISHGCPAGALTPSRYWRRAAAIGAARSLARSERPVLVRESPSLHGSRNGQVIRACGRAAARRSVTVSFSLTGFYPSASLSERVVAVARFPRYGWRVWTVLH